ncbi:hypothetical protein BOTBODRAFT_331681 [Botryobasidium botryosum FD-172 SS1]|uniref:Uncharacterized protein n=1 Tax=Botryobasidium botryosum (strain FD-172 SS1) TaxID=930990 RepID=A0A067MH87_BOTB1|nr:hypothetical protein BOTBODRAFT_331681 [Botryobasidium botryosum FD-172 SS1]
MVVWPGLLRRGLTRPRVVLSLPCAPVALFPFDIISQYSKICLSTRLFIPNLQHRLLPLPLEPTPTSPLPLEILLPSICHLTHISLRNTHTPSNPAYPTHRTSNSSESGDSQYLPRKKSVHSAEVQMHGIRLVGLSKC